MLRTQPHYGEYHNATIIVYYNSNYRVSHEKSIQPTVIKSSSMKKIMIVLKRPLAVKDLIACNSD